MQCKLCNIHNNFDLIYESQEFYLVFDNYGLHYGHMLLIPKQHILNFTSLKAEFGFLLTTIVQILNDFFDKDIIVYEHGNITENKTKNISVDHAHIHLLPTSTGIDSIEQYMGSVMNIHKTLVEDFYSTAQLTPYHFISINGIHSFYTTDKWNSQGFRKMYSHFEKIDKWDWKIDGLEINMRNTMFLNDKQILKNFIIRRLNDVGI